MWICIDKEYIPAMQELIWENPELASKTFTSDSIFIDKDKIEYIAGRGYILYNITENITLRYIKSSPKNICIKFYNGDIDMLKQINLNEQMRFITGVVC